MDGSAKEAKATLATAPNADIMREVLCSLRMRITAGSATFLVKVKSHRGEPVNEQADDLAEEGRQEEDDASTWTTRTGRMIFKKAGEHSGKKSVWTRGVCNMIRSHPVRQYSMGCGRVRQNDGSSVYGGD